LPVIVIDPRGIVISFGESIRHRAEKSIAEANEMPVGIQKDAPIGILIVVTGGTPTIPGILGKPHMLTAQGVAVKSVCILRIDRP